MVKKSISFIMALLILLSFSGCKSKKDISSESSNYAYSSDITESVGSNTADGSSVASGNTDTTSKTESKKNTVDNTANTISTVPQSLKGTKLVVYSWNAAKDVPGAQSIISKFQKETKIKVEWKVGSYQNYKSEIAAMVAAQNSPDIIRLRGVEPGILSLMDPISVSGYDFKEDYWDTNVSAAYTVKGKIFGVNRKNTLLQQPLVMFYNSDLIKKYDLQDPYVTWKKDKTKWNWETFFKMCEDYKKAAGPDSSPWQCNSFKDYAMTFGANHSTRKGDGFISTMGDPKLLAGYQKMAELRTNGIAFFGWNMNDFNNGKYLFFGPAIISARRTHFDLTDMKANGTLGVVPYPCVAGQSTYYQNIFELEAYGIPKGAKNAAAVPYFLRDYLDGDKYDRNTFFNDKRILDVYNYCMTETTWDIECDRWILDLDYGGAKYQEYLSKLVTATKEQIPTIISQYTPVIESAVKAANNDMANEVG